MNENIVAIASIASIGMLVIFVFWLYRDYCVDSFRQSMFALRDSWFNEAAEGKIDFQSSAYGMLRTTMNGLIRFGHRLSLPHLVFISYALKHNSDEEFSVPFAKRLKHSLDALEKDQRHLVLCYYREMNFILVRHLLLSSPLLLITVLVPLVVTLEANRAVKKAVRTLRRPLDSLDTLALAEGEI